eukprot:6113356-Amphidinium_carterae.1
MRAEFWERARRGIERQLQSGSSYSGSHDAAKPWMSVLRDSANDTAYWHEHVETPALLGRGKTSQQHQQQQQPQLGTSSLSTSTPGHVGATPKRMAKPQSKLSKDLRGDGCHIRSNGKELCFTWNRQSDGCQSTCPWGRLHVCEWCLQSHCAIVMSVQHTPTGHLPSLQERVKVTPSSAPSSACPVGGGINPSLAENFGILRAKLDVLHAQRPDAASAG